MEFVSSYSWIRFYVTVRFMERYCLFNVLLIVCIFFENSDEITSLQKEITENVRVNIEEEEMPIYDMGPLFSYVFMETKWEINSRFCYF